MRPRQTIVKHNLNTRKNVYGRPRTTVYNHVVKSVGTQNVVSEEFIERFGMDTIKKQMIHELAKKLIERDMITFNNCEGPIPNSRTITAKLNLVKNG